MNCFDLLLQLHDKNGAKWFEIEIFIFFWKEYYLLQMKKIYFRTAFVK